MKKNVKDIITACIAAFILIAVTVFGFVVIKNSPGDMGILNSKYRNRSQVVLYAGGMTGRGVIYHVDDEFIDILTSRHLIDKGGYGVIVEFANQKQVDALRVYVSDEFDAAMVRVEREEAKEIIGAPVPVEILSKEEYENFTPGEAVYFLQYVYDSNWNVLEGIWYTSNEYIVDLQTEAGIFYGEVVPGMSGEGLFDKDGRLIGIIIAAGEENGAVVPAYELVKDGAFGQ